MSAVSPAEISGTSLTAWALREHAHLRDLFALHQETLFLGQAAPAIRSFALYRLRLRWHIRQEAECLLPYHPAIHGEARWPARVYDLEHRKLHELLGRMRHDLMRWRRQAPDRRTILRVIERELRFKHVVEHHDQREETDLYPELDRRLPFARRMALLASLAAAARPLTALERQHLPALRAALRSAELPEDQAQEPLPSPPSNARRIR